MGAQTHRAQFWLAVLIVGLLGLLAGTACGGQSSPTATPTTAPTTSSPQATSSGSSNSGPIKVGVVLSYTGPLVFEGTHGKDGIGLYFDQHSTIAGRPIKVIYEDAKSDPTAALNATKKLVETDHVNFVLGPVLTSAAYAMRDYVDQHHVIDINVGSVAKELTMDKGSPYVWRTAGSYQINLVAGWYAATKMGYHHAIGAGLDYGAGHDSVAAFAKYFTAVKGNTMVDQVYVPLGTTDMGPYMSKIKQDASQADVLFTFIAGGPTPVQFVKAWRSYGLADGLPIFGNGTLDDEGSSLPQEGQAALGIMDVNQWSRDVNTPTSNKFKSDFQAKYNKQPDTFNVLGYNAALAVGDAIKAVNGNVEDTQSLMNAMHNLKMDAPNGQIYFDKQNEIVEPTYVRKTQMVNGNVANVVVDKVPDVGQYWSPPSQ